MLRVRPVHFTSNTGSWERFLTALGMSADNGLPGGEDNAGRRVFTAGSGRLVLQPVAAGSGEDGTTAFSVEVGDPAEFSRRTNLSAQADITQVEGGACRIAAPDGFSFMAEKAPRTVPSDGADPALAVVGVWFTPDPGAAAATLRHIGARPRPVPDNDETADFTAKNGGVLLVRPAMGQARGGLGFEYDGGLDPLRERLAAAGFSPTVTEEAFGTTVHLPSPDSGTAHAPETVWISLRHPMG